MWSCYRWPFVNSLSPSLFLNWLLSKLVSQHLMFALLRYKLGLWFVEGFLLDPNGFKHIKFISPFLLFWSKIKLASALKTSFAALAFSLLTFPMPLLPQARFSQAAAQMAAILRPYASPRYGALAMRRRPYAGFGIFHDKLMPIFPRVRPSFFFS